MVDRRQIGEHGLVELRVIKFLSHFLLHKILTWILNRLRFLLLKSVFYTLVSRQNGN